MIAKIHIKTIWCTKLIEKSKAMNFNFFQYYTAEFYDSMKARLGEEE